VFVGCFGGYARAWGIGEVTLPGACGLLGLLFQSTGWGAGKMTLLGPGGVVRCPYLALVGSLLSDYSSAWGGWVR
jgi:hypothetical protein